MGTDSHPLDRLTFTAAALMREHPPIWRDRNKRAVFEISCPPGCEHRGQIRYSRWPRLALPERLEPSSSHRFLEVRPDIYDYRPHPDLANATEWHLNFADPNLFFAYGSSLFAQDEMQATEHPALGALREALISAGRPTRTADSGEPTPVLVMGVERRCHVETRPDASQGRPHGLYGNVFARAPEEAVRRATRQIDPPTVSNLIAIAAPRGGHGSYSRREVESVLATAFSGFRAAVIESGAVAGPGSPVIIHTGFWGCGAFGGNRVLMTVLQLLAAPAAGVNRLVFHCVRDAGAEPVTEACRVVDAELFRSGAIGVEEAIDAITAMGFEWGVSDGN